MRFYNREKETQTLQSIENISAEYAQMTVITGRRRIGKTTLIRHAFKRLPLIYFFVGRKSEAMLCRELTEIVKNVLGNELGTFTSMSALFSSLMNISKQKNFTLVFDEFQNFSTVNASFFSDMQHLWDNHKDESQMNLVLCGSLYSMMTKIFDDRKEPLYGRATHRIRLQPFTLDTLKEIMREHHPEYMPDDLLTFYMVTGGVAKYVEQLIMHHAFTKETIIQTVFSYGSYFLEEGRDMLSDEFGKEYGNYFSILAAIASGETSRGEITNYTGIECGGHLDKLEKSYDLINRIRPYLQPEGSRNLKYELKDNFLTFWFRFIYKYRSAIEIGNLEYVQEKVLADYETFSGKILERYFRQKYRETGFYNIVTNYWEKNNLNEIDLIAVNEVDHILIIGECKRNAMRINLHTLQEKSQTILQKQKRFKAEYVGMSLDDM
ncbi:MAG: ATP-binding protein [Bacteroidaceae bacterium]|nr:ATP-binding protein [Bacteroidaceae bacterium]